MYSEYAFEIFSYFLATRSLVPLESASALNIHRRCKPLTNKIQHILDGRR